MPPDVGKGYFQSEAPKYPESSHFPSPVEHTKVASRATLAKNDKIITLIQDKNQQRGVQYFELGIS